MAGMLQLEVATPERMLLKEQVREVEVPGAGGALGILPEHAPLLSEIGNGRLGYVLADGRRKWMAVCGGYVEVQPDRVRILADRAENADEIDVNRAAAALKRAEERVLHPLPGVDVARALNAAARAQARLTAAKSAK
ncbi:MAG: F0F1 ATP synthase subunit epsilon [Acidobacteria bacterium]|nr:F0F1 ATP synthase subunit epsilon [Acidobacteriota bacterium]